MSDDVSLVYDEGRDGAALNYLGLSPFFFKQLQFDKPRTGIAPADDAFKTVKTLLDQILDRLGIVFFIFEFTQYTSSDMFNLKGVPQIAGMKMIYQTTRAGSALAIEAARSGSFVISSITSRRSRAKSFL